MAREVLSSAVLEGKRLAQIRLLGVISRLGNMDLCLKEFERILKFHTHHSDFTAHATQLGVKLKTFKDPVYHFSEAEIKRRIAEAIGITGNVRGSRLIALMLDDKEASVRQAAAEAAGKIGARHLIDKLKQLTILTTQEYPEGRDQSFVRSAAIEALIRMGQLDYVIERFTQDEINYQTSHELEMLAPLGEPRFIPSLISLLRFGLEIIPTLPATPPKTETPPRAPVIELLAALPPIERARFYDFLYNQGITRQRWAGVASVDEIITHWLTKKRLDKTPSPINLETGRRILEACERDVDPATIDLILKKWGELIS